jgi:MarR family 2-MHQ and catechol resistance regulon transcriptional repressor
MPTHYKGTPEEELALNTYIKLRRAMETLNGRLFPGGKFEGLTASQFGTLEVLYHLGAMCQGEIGNKILKSSGNMTMVIDNLEKRGLVKRERDDDDRRQVIVTLTEKGENIIVWAFEQHLAQIMDQFEVLSASEQQMLGKLLKKLGMQMELA